jgi:hypothetical protein
MGQQYALELRWCDGRIAPKPAIRGTAGRTDSVDAMQPFAARESLAARDPGRLAALPGAHNQTGFCSKEYARFS